MKKIHSNFATLLADKHLKVSNVARDTGISRTTLTKLYYGTGQAIAFATITKLCTYFNCGISELLELKGGE